MKCQVCKIDVPEGASFCQHCGAKLPMIDPDSIETAAAEAPETVAQRSKPADENRKAAASGVRRRGPVDVPEETLWEGSFSPKAMIGPAIGCAVLSLVLFVVAFALAAGVWRWLLLLAIVLTWVAVGLRLAQKRLGISYKLTTHMFYHRRGLLTRSTDRIELIEIHDVIWQQGLFERLVNVGRIKIESGDRSNPVFYVIGIENVESVSQLIDKARRDEQVRRGRRIDFSHVEEG